MIAEIKGAIEDHPYVSGSVVLGIIVLFFVSRSSGSKTSAPATVVQGQSGPSDNVQVAELQAATAAAASQNAGILANNQLNAALAAKQLDATTQTTANQLAAQVELEKLHVTGDVTNNANNFAYLTTLSNNKTTLGVTQFNDAAQIEIAKTNAGVNTSLFQTLINAFAGTSKTNQTIPSTSTTSPATTQTPMVFGNFYGGQPQPLLSTYALDTPIGAVRGR